MVSTASKYPSRARYEANNPVVSFRISREEYERLNAVRERQGKSFKDIIMTGAGLIEARIEEERVLARNSVKIGTCTRCNKPMIFNLNDDATLNQIAKALAKRGWCHSRCPE